MILISRDGGELSFGEGKRFEILSLVRVLRILLLVMILMPLMWMILVRMMLVHVVLMTFSDTKVTIWPWNNV